MLQQQLHINHIEPSAELMTDLFEMSNLFKTEPCMQPNTRLIARINTSEYRMQPALARSLDQWRHEKFPHALAAVLRSHVNRILSRKSIPDPIVKTIQGTP